MWVASPSTSTWLYDTWYIGQHSLSYLDPSCDRDLYFHFPKIVVVLILLLLRGFLGRETYWIITMDIFSWYHKRIITLVIYTRFYYFTLRVVSSIAFSLFDYFLNTIIKYIEWVLHWSGHLRFILTTQMCLYQFPLLHKETTVLLQVPVPA